jgi:hypothetical protein
MTQIKERVVELLMKRDGLTDREVTDLVLGRGAAQQSINQICRELERKGIITRTKKDGRIRNFVAKNTTISIISEHQQQIIDIPKNGEYSLSEDVIKKHLENWLIENGWKVQIAWGHSRGIDIHATRENKRWIIEVKGEGSRPQMRVNYFLSILGEILQRMDDPEAKYSIALPDIKQFRLLWERFPSLAKKRTGISILFVDSNGKISYKE